MPLNDKQIEFCKQYIACKCNGTKAYMAAYPDSTEEAARSSASDLLSNPSVKEYIAKLEQPIHEKLGITAEMILGGIRDIANDEETNKRDKLKALELLAKYKDLALFAENHNVNHSGKVDIEPIKIEFVGEADKDTTD